MTLTFPVSKTNKQLKPNDTLRNLLLRALSVLKQTGLEDGDIHALVQNSDKFETQHQLRFSAHRLCAVPTPRATGAHQKYINVTLKTRGLFAGIYCLKRLYSLTPHLTALTLGKTTELT